MSYKFELYIGASPDKVWEALVGPEGTRAIFFGSILESDLKPGASFAYVGPGNEGERTVHVYGNIEFCEPGRSLVMTEHPGPSYYENHAELTSRISYTLEPVGACTKLTLVNDEYTPGHPSLERSGENWAVMLSSLKTYAETGRTLDLGW